MAGDPRWDAVARLHHALAVLARLRTAIEGGQPVTQSALNGIEDDLNGIEIRLHGALAILEVEIDRVETQPEQRQ